MTGPMRDVGYLPPLPEPDIRELIAHAQAGDERAKELVVRHNLGLALQYAGYMQRRGHDVEEAFAGGVFALLRAVEKFNLDAGTRFSTYAYWWVKQGARNAIVLDEAWIRLPMWAVEAAAKMARCRDELGKELGRDPTPEEVAERSGLSPGKIRIMERQGKPRRSTSQRGEGDPLEVLASRGRDHGQDLDYRDEIEAALRLLDAIPERSAMVLRLRFGIGEEGPLTLKEIGERCGVTRERVRQIELDAIDKLRTLAKRRAAS